MLQRIRGAKTMNLRELREEGFTLIELLIVIVVLGVLAGITVFGVAQFKSDSETAACNATKKTVETAAEAFHAQKNAYPADVDALVAGKYLKAGKTPENITISNTGVVGGTCTGDLV